MENAFFSKLFKRRLQPAKPHLNVC